MNAFNAFLGPFWAILGLRSRGGTHFWLKEQGGDPKGRGQKVLLGRSKGGPRGIWTVFGVEESIFAGFKP